jgi:FecR-like protein
MKSTAVCVVLSSLALLVAALTVPAVADPRVGVTSATTGGPTGKPPAQAERVLHVGVDVQANEIVTTGSNDRAHLLFLDGSSLTVGPQARLTIDRFVYDPNTKTGTLAINASQGIFRFVGGRISKTSPVTVTTPSATLSIRGGIMIGSADANRTVAIFVYGIDMTVAAKSSVTTVTRPGWQVTTYAGQVPGQPVPTPPGSLAGELAKLEAIGNKTGGDADKAAKDSGFSDQNSGLGPGGQPIGGNNTTIGGEATNAVNNANTSLQKPTINQPPPPPPIPPAGIGPGCGLRC